MNSPVRGEAEGPFSLYYAHFNCSIQLKESVVSTSRVRPDLRRELDRAVLARSQSRLQLAMLQLVAGALAALPESNLRGPITDARAARACELMQAHLHTRLSNRELALQLGISESALLRLFRETLGVSPQKEHLRLRLNHAAALLQQTNQSIEQVAAACGFWDRNHFTRLFTREWQIPPGRYRRSSTPL